MLPYELNLFLIAGAEFFFFFFGSDFVVCFDAYAVSAKENASGGNLAGLPKVPANTLGSDSNAINSPVCVFLVPLACAFCSL